MTRVVVWGIVLSLLAGAAMVSARAPRSSQAGASPASGPSDPELERCRALGAEAQHDTACAKAWRAARMRFLTGARR